MIAELILRYWLKRSIKKESVLAPILVSKSGKVLDGNHRVMLARKLGIKVPIIRLDKDEEFIDPNELVTYYDLTNPPPEGTAAGT